MLTKTHGVPGRAKKMLFPLLVSFASFLSSPFQLSVRDVPKSVAPYLPCFLRIYRGRRFRLLGTFKLEASGGEKGEIRKGTKQWIPQDGTGDRRMIAGRARFSYRTLLHLLLM